METLVATLKVLGFEHCLADLCTFHLRADGHSVTMTVVRTDDMIVAGSQVGSKCGSAMH